MQIEQDLSSEQQINETRELVSKVLDSNDNGDEDEVENTAKFIINNYIKLSTK